MVGKHHRLNVHESEQTLGAGDEQGGLECRSPWGRKSRIQQSDLTELNSSFKTILMLPLSKNIVSQKHIWKALFKISD